MWWRHYFCLAQVAPSSSQKYWGQFKSYKRHRDYQERSLYLTIQPPCYSEYTQSHTEQVSSDRPWPLNTEGQPQTGKYSFTAFMPWHWDMGTKRGATEAGWLSSGKGRSGRRAEAAICLWMDEDARHGAGIWTAFRIIHDSSGAQPPQGCGSNTVPCVWWPPCEISWLLFHNCKFAAVMNCNVNTHVFRWSWLTPEKGSRPTGWEPLHYSLSLH